MRSSSFRSDSSSEGDLQERTQQRRFHWDKIFYLGLLALLLFLLARYVVYDYFYIESDGQVVTRTSEAKRTSNVPVTTWPSPSM